jgi:hypothetical protein
VLAVLMFFQAPVWPMMQLDVLSATSVSSDVDMLLGVLVRSQDALRLTAGLQLVTASCLAHAVVQQPAGP